MVCNSNLAKDSLIIMVGQIFSGITNMISILIYTRIFITSDYGLYSLLNSAISLSVSILTGWLSSSTLRLTDTYRKSHKEFISTLIMLLCILYVIASIVILVLFFIYDSSTPILMALPLFISISLYNTASSFLRSEGTSVRYSVYLSIIPSLRLILMLILFNTLSIGIYSLFWASVITDLLIVGSIADKYKIIKSICFRRYSSVIAIRCFKYGLPLTASSAMLWILNVSDRYVIKYFRNLSEAGLYSIGYDVVNRTIAMTLTAVAVSSYPVLIRSWRENNKEETSFYLGQAIYYFLIISVPILILFSVYNKEIFLYILDPDYFKGYVCLPWIAAGTVSLGLAHNCLNRIWQLEEKTGIIFFLSGISAILNLVLNLIFVPVYGFYAAAVTTTVSCLFYLAASVLLARKSLKPRFTGLYMRNIVLAGIAAMSLGMFIKHQKYISNIFLFIISSGIIAGVYFTVIILLDGEIRSILISWYKKIFVHKIKIQK